MAKDIGVFLPDEQEQQITKKSPSTNGDEVRRVEPAKADNADPANLSEQELKSAIIVAWKKHEELAKADLAPLLYWLREKLKAQGARNDLTHDKHRGWELWVTTHLDISRSTADAWCLWYAQQVGLVPTPTSTDVGGSDEDDFYEDILDSHKGRQKITVSYYLPPAVHARYQKALTKLQEQFGLEDKNEAVVQGVIYAASVIDRGEKAGRNKGVRGKVPISKPVRARRSGRVGGSSAQSHARVRA